MANQAQQRSAKQSAVFGVLAGILFAAMQVVAMAGMGRPPLLPFRMFASVLLGEAAMEHVTASGAVVVGTLVHLVLSAFFGTLYGLFNANQAAETRTRWGNQAALGLVYGLVLWLVNIQIIARVLYPWFLDVPQFSQLLLHAFFFGLPLALMYAAAERRIRRMRRAEV